MVHQNSVQIDSENWRYSADLDLSDFGLQASSCYKQVIRSIGNRWTKYTKLKGDYVENKKKIIIPNIMSELEQKYTNFCCIVLLNNVNFLMRKHRNNNEKGTHKILANYY